MTSALPANVQRDAETQGWHARLELEFKPRPDKTVLARRVQRGPLAVQRPFYPEDKLCHVYLLHPPGGVVGGDVLEISTQVKTGAQALITSPGAMKFYRSQGKTALQHQLLKVEEGASLEWLPQETIYFPGAQATMQTHIELDASSAFIGWEIHCLGLPANNERFHAGELQIELAVYQAGIPLILEKMPIQADTISRPTGLRGQPVMGTMLATSANSDDLELVRTLFEDDKLVSMTLLDTCLLIRYLGDSTAHCRALFTKAWKALRPTIIGRPASEPRIWST
jgi:urease accessory protein